MRRKWFGLLLALALCLPAVTALAQQEQLYLSSETAVDLSPLENGYAYVAGGDAGGAGKAYAALPQSGWTWAVRKDADGIYTLILNNAQLTGYAALSEKEKCGVLFSGMQLCVELWGDNLISTTGGAGNTAATIVGIRGEYGGLVFVGDGELEVRSNVTGSAQNTVGIRITSDGASGNDAGCVRVSGQTVVTVSAGKSLSCTGLDLSRDLVADGGTLRASAYEATVQEKNIQSLGMKGRNILMKGGGVQLSGSTRASSLTGAFKFAAEYPMTYYYFRNLTSAQRPESYHVSGYAKFVYNQNLKYLRVQEDEPLPQTGDTAQPMLWGLMMALALLAMGGMAWQKVQKQRR